MRRHNSKIDTVSHTRSSLVKLPSLVYLTMSGYKFDKKELQPARQTVIVLKEITAKKLFEPGHVGTSVILAHFRLE